jgi:predicted ester cyclase
MEHESDRKSAARLARLSCELWSTGDVTIVDQVFPPEARYSAGTGKPWGEFITAIRHDFPDLGRPLEHAYIDADSLVIRTRLQGTHTGGPGFFQFPPTGVRMDTPAVTAFRVANNMLVEELWSEYDLRSVEMQIAAAVVSDYLEKAWGDGNEQVLQTHVASGHVLHLNGQSNAVEGRRRLGTYISDTRTRWDDGVFRVDEVIAGGDWGERVAYRWSAAESGNDAAAILGFGFARLQNGVVAEEWLQLA